MSNPPKWRPRRARARRGVAAIAAACGLCALHGAEAASVWQSEPARPVGCASSVEANRRVVLDFYALALIGRQPRAAFERYAAPGFIEHKPDVENGTRDGAIRYLEELIAAVPEPRWEIVRTIAEDDLVFLHARFTPSPGAPAYAVADVFRVRDCLIVEHWDVIGPPPAEPRNPHSRF